MNGIDYQKLSTSELRKNISVLFQDYAKYNVSARQNIWFGNTELNEQDNTIITAAQQSGADAVISGLSNGYNTILGKMFEKGEEISIGEWQKVALARAFLRQSKMLILDEPTSSLDAKMEHEIFQQFHELTQGKTALLISHRLSTVKMADRILVMHDGQIIEQGTHDQLIDLNGLYAELFNRQAQFYQ